MSSCRKKSVLFVCLGNTCRSPIAEAVFNKMLKDYKQTETWVVDSAAIANWHVGKSHNPRSLSIMEKYDLLPYSNTARQITEKDFQSFDFILGMDVYNLEDLQHLAGSGFHSQLFVLGEFDPEKILNIQDPYWDSGPEGFEACYRQCLRSCKSFLEEVTNMKG